MMNELLNVQALSVRVPIRSGEKMRSAAETVAPVTGFRLRQTASSRTILDDVSFSLAPGEHLCIVGPNGAGKSTIVNSIAQSIAYTGRITYLGRDLKEYRSVQLARILGVLSQSHEISYSFSVRELVRMGRYAYTPTIFSPRPADDEEKIDEALALTGLSGIQDRSVLTLSGGELQRVFLAQLFAQDPQILVLDEPANHLDLQYQMQLFSLLEKWLAKDTVLARGDAAAAPAQAQRAIISVVHDLSLAMTFADRVLLLHEGRVRGFGTPKEVLNRENLESIYGMDVYSWMNRLLSNWQSE